MTKGVTSVPQHPWFETSTPPLICMHFPARFADEELREALDVVSKWLLEEVDAPFGFIADFTEALSISPKQRSMMAAAEKSYAHVDLAYNAGQAVVVTSGLMRGIITAVSWLSPPVYPLKVCADMAAAKLFVETQLRLGLADFPGGKHWKRRGKG